MMNADAILDKYGLTKETTVQYIDAITRMNQTDTADQINVSRDTVNRYKKIFSKMSELERAQLIASLTTDKLLHHAHENADR